MASSTWWSSKTDEPTYEIGLGCLLFGARKSPSDYGNPTESELSLWLYPIYDTVRGIGHPSRVIAHGRVTRVREGFLHDSITDVSDARRVSFLRVQYSPPGSLSFTPVPDSLSFDAQILDGSGPILEVYSIDEGILSGRWAEGGISMIAYPTPVGMLMEKGSGYFCAWPVGERLR